MIFCFFGMEVRKLDGWEIVVIFFIDSKLFFIGVLGVDYMVSVYVVCLLFMFIFFN